MDLVRGAFVVAVVGILAALGSLLASVPDDVLAPATTATSPADGPVTPDGLEAPSMQVTWQGRDVILLQLPALELDAATRSHAASLPGQNDKMLVAYESKSTFLGCGVSWQPDIRDGVLLDDCHHGMWRPQEAGAPVQGTPTNDQALPLLEANWIVRDGQTVLGLRAT